ncbi:MAG: cadherin-like domain-containing protein, partial [Caldilineaceae bacterium]|nr:cadherin-like domain-containing protein [Caldilineaceae bacterium]
MFFLSYGTAQAAPSRQVVAPPQPVADTITIEEDTPTTIDVLANDGLGGGTALILAAVSNPPAGTAVIVDNKVLYTPNANFSGVDRFLYIVHNGDLFNARLASVRVTVTAVDDGPSDILLSNATVAEDAQIGQVVGAFSAEGDSEAGTS